jgi:thymidylate synthase ThyX/5-methylcytosine-specific restriction endonuclease McrA
LSAPDPTPPTDIRVIREPEVYLLGRQTVDDAELDRFLKDHGVSWQTDTEVAAEALCETAGRTCYMSFLRPRPGGNAAYLHHIKESGHGSVLEHAVWNFLITGISRSCSHEFIRHRAGAGYCLGGDTLVYSERRAGGHRNGPKKRRLADLYEMTKSPHGRSRIKLLRLRCLDETTGTFTVGRVAAIAHSGVKPVFRLELDDGKTITCSRDHRFLTPGGWKPLHEIAGGLAVSANGLAVYGKLDTPILTNGNLAYKDKSWLEEQYVRRGFEQTQIAGLAGVSVHTIRSWVRKHRLQKPVGSWTVGREPWNKGRKYRAGWRHSPDTLRRLAEQKRGPRNPQWKGGVTPQGHVLRKPVMDRRHEIYARDDFRCRLCGRRGGPFTLHHVIPVWARPDLAGDSANVVTLCRPCHLSLNGRELEFARRPVGHRAFVPRAVLIQSITYVGEQDTYDIEMAGPHHNFVANGIVTHNSQLSQRYVDESVAEYVEPDVIAADPETHALWLDAVGHAHRAYVRLAALLADRMKDEPDRTARRKAARQAARSVLPNATETKIFCTLNARAARNVIEQRGSRHAEPEIRKLAGKMLDILQREAPNLFGDYERVPLPDGTVEVTTPYRKV